MLNQLEIFYRFLLLGFVSFGGPVAHIAYFRKAFVDKLKWLDDESYSKIVALSQFLPGPSSSQVGFTIGLKRGGVLGAILAFIGFTLPSFLMLYFLYIYGIFQSENEYIKAVIYALKLFAVVVVLDAILGMFKTFCKDRITIFIFAFSSILLVFFNQIVVLILSGIIGFMFIKSESKVSEKIKLPNLYILFLFLALLFLAFAFEYKNELLNLFFDFYKSGSLVFGGGHVVLPLLQENLETKVSNDSFLIAYSLAQTVPGPMFTIATYLGADILKESPILGAVTATIGIFLGGFLLILCFYKSFESFSKNEKLSRIIKAINASVVALLFATLINTIIPNSVYNLFDGILVLIGFVLIRFLKLNIFYIILIFNFVFLIKTMSY